MMRHRAAILPMVLFTILLVGLLGAVFAFRIHSDVAATSVLSDRLQSRLAAEAGVEWVRTFLRTGRHATSSWYHNPDAFHRIVLWADGEDAKVTGTNEEFNKDVAYRFSIVADDPTDDEDYIRFGLTDEASKLNLNTATEAQLINIVTLAAAEREDVDIAGVVNAILDWRDGDKKPRGEAADTEGVYYRTLPKPYAVKNGPFDTVEELLLVKGVTPDLLFGEDFDRNGLLSDNEKDGGLSFPPDNQDDVLNRGLYPYLTVFSYESNNSSKNRPRAYLFAKEDTLRPELELIFEGNPSVIDFIVKATRKAPQGGQGGPGGPKPDGSGDGSEGAGDGEEGGDGSGDPGNEQPGGDLPPPTGDDGQQGGDRPNAGPGRGPFPMTPGGRPPQGQPDGQQQPRQPRRPRQSQPQSNAIEDGPMIDGKQVVLARLQDEGAANTGNQGSQPGQNPQNPRPRPGSGVQDPGRGRGGQPGPGNPQQEEQNPDGQIPDGAGAEGENPEGGKPGGSGGTGDGGPESRPIRSPADLMFPRKVGNDIVPSPLTPDDLALLMDATTVHPPDKKKIEGLININTAPRPVLECIAELTGEQIEAILAARERLEGEQALTPAWLVSEGILDLETFASVAPQLTARAQQFTIESLGYADHQGMVTRLQVVVDMFGPIAQPIYVRDISYLGATYPIREEDLEQQRAR